MNKISLLRKFISLTKKSLKLEKYCKILLTRVNAMMILDVGGSTSEYSAVEVLRCGFDLWRREDGLIFRCG